MLWIANKRYVIEEIKNSQRIRFYSNRNYLKHRFWTLYIFLFFLFVGNPLVVRRKNEWDQLRCSFQLIGDFSANSPFTRTQTNEFCFCWFIYFVKWMFFRCQRLDKKIIICFQASDDKICPLPTICFLIFVKLYFVSFYSNVVLYLLIRMV